MPSAYRHRRQSPTPPSTVLEQQRPSTVFWKPFFSLLESLEAFNGRATLVEPAFRRDLSGRRVYLGAGGGGGGRKAYARADTIHHLPPLFRSTLKTCALRFTVEPSGLVIPEISASSSTSARVGSRNRIERLV